MAMMQLPILPPNDAVRGELYPVVRTHLQGAVRTSVPRVGQGDRRVRKRLDPFLPSTGRVVCMWHQRST